MASDEIIDLRGKVAEVLQNLLKETCLSKHISVSNVSSSDSLQTAAIGDKELVSKTTKLLDILQNALTVLKNESKEIENGRAISVADRKPTNPDLVQITAENSEIKRRIQAFMERKRGEVDRTNQREFCSVVSSSDEDCSCARTDAIFIPRGDTISHVKVSRVSWEYGPQTRPHLISAENRSIIPTMKRSPGRKRNHGVEERLHNMESFLKLSPGQKHSDSAAIFNRLKALEERILHLEGMSPEYLTIASSPFKRQRMERSNQEGADLKEIDDKIKKLKEALKNKKVEKSEKS